jgi:hypothetical protein|tara:strand:+ start:272 stop:1066 length:795 start_codon:yes stop_codon:yes gene_type:complete
MAIDNWKNDFDFEEVGVTSKVSPSRVEQIEKGAALDSAYQKILSKFFRRFPGAREDFNSANPPRIEDMVAMLQLEGTMNTEGAGILDLAEGAKMITPSSVDKATQSLMRHHDFSQGGRTGYAYGDEDPEIVEDELSTIELMQDQGIPYGQQVQSDNTGIMNQASGINKDILIKKVVEEFIKRKGRRPRSNDEIIEFYMKEMAGGSAPQKVAYNPGDYDPLIVEEYEKYKAGQNEQGLPVISIDDFLLMERSNVARGGLPGLLGV